MPMLISEKGDFRRRNMDKNDIAKKYIMTKGMIHQERTKNLCACNNRYSKYVKQNLSKLKVKIDTFTIKVEPSKILSQ